MNAIVWKRYGKHNVHAAHAFRDDKQMCNVKHGRLGFEYRPDWHAPPHVVECTQFNRPYGRTCQQCTRLVALIEAGVVDFWMERCCESPIERLFLASLLNDGWYRPKQEIWSRHYETLRVITGDRHIWIFTNETPDYVILAPQLATSGYRIDFALVAWGEQYAIELDGHDFHERTKEQAQRDKSRDRALTAAGWKMVRFTGSEVYRNARGCLEELNKLIMGSYDRWYDRREEIRKAREDSQP